MNARLMALVAATIAAVGCLSIGAAGAAAPARPPWAAGRAGLPQAAPPNTITATFDVFCANYGFDVVNTTAVAHSVTLSVNGTAQQPVVVAAGATGHVPLATNTQPASNVVLADADGTVLGQLVVRFCTQVINRSVTIKAGTSYTLADQAPDPTVLMAPTPIHGTAVRINGGTAIRYTPDPCFAGTDRFGYDNSVEQVQGVITVTVLPGPCPVSVQRTATNCAARTVGYTVANSSAQPVELVETGGSGSSAVRHFVVPAHATQAIVQVSGDPGRPSTERFTFSIVDPLITLLTDTVTFPCPAAAGSGPQLAATGSASGQQVGWAAGAIAAGALLTWLGRRRVRRSPAA
ncbi:MAG: hypothetical protein ABI775_01950 [Pseudonocardiales bacterium]